VFQFNINYRLCEMYQQLEATDNEHFEGNETLKQKSIEEFTRFVQNHSFITLHVEFGNKLS